MGSPQYLGNLHSFVRVFSSFSAFSMVLTSFSWFGEIWRDLGNLTEKYPFWTFLLTPFWTPFFRRFSSNLGIWEIPGFGNLGILVSGIWEIWVSRNVRECARGESGVSRNVHARFRGFRQVPKRTPLAGPYRPLFKCGCAFFPGRSLGGHFGRIALL